jgi:hypothetical protein
MGQMTPPCCDDKRTVLSLCEIIIRTTDGVQRFDGLRRHKWPDIVGAVLYFCSTHCAQTMTMHYDPPVATGRVTMMDGWFATTTDKVAARSGSDRTVVSVDLLPLVGSFHPSPINFHYALLRGDDVTQLINRGVGVGIRTRSCPHIWTAVTRHAQRDMIIDRLKSCSSEPNLTTGERIAWVYYAECLVGVRASGFDVDVNGNSMLHHFLRIDIAHSIQNIAFFVQRDGELVTLIRNDDSMLPSDTVFRHWMGICDSIIDETISVLRGHQNLARFTLRTELRLYVIAPLTRLIVDYL